MACPPVVRLRVTHRTAVCTMSEAKGAFAPAGVATAGLPQGDRPLQCATTRVGYRISAVCR